MHLITHHNKQAGTHTHTKKALYINAIGPYGQQVIAPRNEVTAMLSLRKPLQPKASHTTNRMIIQKKERGCYYFIRGLQHLTHVPIRRRGGGGSYYHSCWFLLIVMCSPNEHMTHSCFFVRPINDSNMRGGIPALVIPLLIMQLLYLSEAFRR